MKRISASEAAAKLHAAREGNATTFAEQLAEQPRMAELLWNLQWASWQPGGLDAFVADLIQHHGEHFQIRAMREAGSPDADGRYSLAQCLAIWRTEFFNESELPGAIQDSYQELFESCPVDVNPDQVSYRDFTYIFIHRSTTPADAVGNSPKAVALRRGLERFNVDFLRAQCASEARQHLPRFLSDLCTMQHIGLSAPRYCPTLPKLLFAHIDRLARETASQIAETEITRTVRRELEFAISECVPVPCIGDSRFGKTKAIANYCAMHPGRARLVTIPNNTNSEMAFMRAHADALGIEYTVATKLHALRDEVEFVLRNSGLAVIYDEAHALAPIGYTKTTAPRRLNWVRSAVIDQGVPCAFFATPQSKLDTLEQYAKTTGYNLSQWVGRMAPPVILSDVICQEDIIAVARTQFPELTQTQLEEMADRAILSDGYLKNIELAGRRARFLARERGHTKPSTQDVMDACDDMMAGAPRFATAEPTAPPILKRQPAKATRGAAPALPMQPRGSRPATPLPRPGNLEFPRRSATPGRLFKEPVTVG